MSELIRTRAVCDSGCCVAVRDASLGPPIGQRATDWAMFEIISDAQRRRTGYRWTPGEPYIEPPRTVK